MAMTRRKCWTRTTLRRWRWACRRPAASAAAWTGSSCCSAIRTASARPSPSQPCARSRGHSPMLNERSVREHPDETLASLRRRHAGPNAERALEQWLALDAGRRATATRRDTLARRVAELRGAGGTTVGPDLRAAEHELRAVEEALVVVAAQARRALQRLPNLPDARVPEGDGPERNVELRRWGEPPAFDFAPRRHDELGAALGILDLPRATRLSGSRFPLLIGAGARLARALASFMLDLHVAHGYVEVAPPHLLKTETLEGT